LEFGSQATRTFSVLAGFHPAVPSIGITSAAQDMFWHCHRLPGNRNYTAQKACNQQSKTLRRDPWKFHPGFYLETKKESGCHCREVWSLGSPNFYGLAGFPPAVPFISFYVHHTGYVYVILKDKIFLGYPVIAIIQRKRRVIGKARDLESKNQDCPYGFCLQAAFLAVKTHSRRARIGQYGI
jgi:hypothetical protein